MSDSRIDRYYGGAPRDERLQELGIAFSEAVEDMKDFSVLGKIKPMRLYNRRILPTLSFENARVVSLEILSAIEVREVELINQIEEIEKRRP